MSRPRPVFPARRDRQRVAIRRAHGLSVMEIAAVERSSRGEVEALLAEPDMARLVAAHAHFTELPYTERLERLKQVALDMLQLRLLARDLRAAIFFVREMQSGRDPARSLAEAVIVAAERQALRPPPPTEDAMGLRLRFAPEPHPEAVLGRIEAATDLAVAREEAEAETAAFEGRLETFRHKLVREVADEAARIDSAADEDEDRPHRAAARLAAKRGRARLEAQRRADRRADEEFARGRTTTAAERNARAAIARFAERSCIETRLALLRRAGPPGGTATLAARRVAVWPIPPPR